MRTQSANVNALLTLASYERLMILHDDDMLTDGAVDRLASAWDAEDNEVDAVYGRQYISDADGTVDHERTASNDKYYYKDVAEGVQPSNLWAALVAQFPNDGMVRRVGGDGVPCSGRACARGIRATATSIPSGQDLARPVSAHRVSVFGAPRRTRPA
jgi:hypothetical protein